MNSEQLINNLILKNTGRTGNYSHIATVFPVVSVPDKPDSLREKCFEGGYQ